MNETRSTLVENRVLRRMFDVTEKVQEGGQKLHNDELHNM
jgi:hypothetical protein